MRVRADEVVPRDVIAPGHLYSMHALGDEPVLATSRDPLTVEWVRHESPELTVIGLASSRYAILADPAKVVFLADPEPQCGKPHSGTHCRGCGRCAVGTSTCSSCGHPGPHSPNQKAITT